MGRMHGGSDIREVFADCFEHYIGVRPTVRTVNPDSEEGQEMKERILDPTPRASRIAENRAKGEQMRKDWDENPQIETEGVMTRHKDKPYA